MYVAIDHMEPGGRCRACLRHSNHKRPDPPILAANGGTQAEALAKLRTLIEEALNTVERFASSHKK